MLEKIKSKYILKFIFTYVNERRKLMLIQINKKIIDKLEIKLINYQFLAGKYRIGKRNGKGKEYDSFDDNLVFEGEYLSGKRTGYGKEYTNFNNYQAVIFEGEYLKGKRTGYGKEFYYKGNIKFEGIYLFGLKYSGKGYDKHWNIVYELTNGKGYIKDYDYFGNLLFEGEYPNGQGKEYYDNNKLKFEGEYINGIRWNGVALDKYNNIIGELKEGKGYLKEYDYFGKLIFEGEYLYGKRNGKGKENSSINKGLFYEGEFKDGKRNGYGKEYINPGKTILFEGEYLYGRRKKGKEYYINGKLEFEGEYLFDKKYNGKGFDENGNIIYELNKGAGKVKEYFNGILIFDGEYINGKDKIKKGKKYDNQGNLIFEGEYLNRKEWNGISRKIKSNYDGYKITEIEYRNGKKNGTIIKCNKDKLIYEGKYRKEKIKKFDGDGDLIFEGIYFKGKPLDGIYYEYKMSGFLHKKKVLSAKYEYLGGVRNIIKNDNY